jgi:hypothetical protein
VQTELVLIEVELVEVVVVVDAVEVVELADSFKDKTPTFSTAFPLTSLVPVTTKSSFTQASGQSVGFTERG